MQSSEVALVKGITCVWAEGGFGRTAILLQGFVVNQSCDTQEAAAAWRLHWQG